MTGAVELDPVAALEARIEEAERVLGLPPVPVEQRRAAAALYAELGAVPPVVLEAEAARP